MSNHISHQHYGQYFKKVSINELREIIDYKKNEIEVLKKELEDRLNEEKEIAFEYMPYPLQNNTFKLVNGKCDNCKKKNKYLSKQHLHELGKELMLCHKCIKDGIIKDNKKIEFNCYDIHELDFNKIKSIKNVDKWEQISHHTPHISTFQGLAWRIHCNEPCEYIGIAKNKEITSLSEKELIELEKLRIFGMSKEQLLKEHEGTPELETDFLMFRCKKCETKLFALDLD